MTSVEDEEHNKCHVEEAITEILEYEIHCNTRQHFTQSFGV